MLLKWIQYLVARFQPMRFAFFSVSYYLKTCHSGTASHTTSPSSFSSVSPSVRSHVLQDALRVHSQLGGWKVRSRNSLIHARG